MRGLLMRLLALGVLTFCLFLLSRSDRSLFLGASAEPSLVITQEPAITAELHEGAPLIFSGIASAGRMTPSSETVEFGYYLINVSSKPIRAYAIKQTLSAGGKELDGGINLFNPQLSHSLLQPKQSTFIGGTFNITSGEKNILVLSVDFVEFSDGTRWGADSEKSGERVAGQREAVSLVSEKLLQMLNEGKVGDVISAVEAGTTDVEPRGNRSKEFNEGFRMGRASLLNRLKRAKVERGTAELERQLKQFRETFKPKE